MAKVPFKRIRERAAKRKGGEKVLASLMPKKPNNKALAKLGDDRVLSEMAARVFSAGFVWSVIDQKWPGFEEAFLEFNPKRLLFQPAEFWEKLASDKRIVRNPQKIRSVRENARFVSEIAAEHGSFGKFWPTGRPTTRPGCSRSSPSAARGWAASAASTCCASSAGTPSCCRATCCCACVDAGRADQRHRHVEEGPASAAQAQINAWAGGERPADDPRLAHLRAVDRREPRRGAAERGHAAMTDILLINPNTTASITDLVLKTARRFASKGTSLRAVTGAFGPRYIASRVGYAIAGHAAVDAFANDRGRKDAVVLACFGDPGPGRAEGDRQGAGGRHGRRLDPAGLRHGQPLLHRHRRRALEVDAGGIRGEPRSRLAACLDPHRRADRRRHCAQSEGGDGAAGQGLHAPACARTAPTW